MKKQIEQTLDLIKDMDWQELRQWLVSRGILLKESREAFVMWTNPLYMTNRGGIVSRIALVWGWEDTGFSWYRSGPPLYNDNSEIVGWCYIMPLIDIYQLKIESYVTDSEAPMDVFLGRDRDGSRTSARPG